MQQKGVETSQPSSAVWGQLGKLMNNHDDGDGIDEGSHTGQEDADQAQASSLHHHNNQPPGEGQDWKKFVTSFMKDEDGDGAANPQQHLMTGTKSRATSAKSGMSRKTVRSYVEELEQQQGVPHGDGVDSTRKKQPKKGVLKVTRTEDGHGDASTNGAAPNKPSPQELFKIILPSLDTNGWDMLVHQIVWKVGRHFGFQAFNANPHTRNLAVEEYVPGSIFLAGDHLGRLLCACGYIRHGARPGEPDEERLAKALAELHATIFFSYEKWCGQVKLPWRSCVAQKVLMDNSYADPRVMSGLLAELSLWFLIYTESSSLRHTPELMWFIYWCMTMSFVMSDFWHRELPAVEPNMKDRRIELRNLHQKIISEVQNQLQIYPKRVRPEDCGRLSAIIARLQDTDVDETDFQLVGDLIAFGDGGFYCDRIVTPIFDVFAYEVDHLSNVGVDVALRLGYDDFNETMCVEKIVHDTLRELRVKPEQLKQATINDAYMSLTNLGFARGAAMSKFEVAVASEFWHTKVFVKTYIERRTWAAMYRAYFRVFAFHIIAYQFLQVLAFTGWDFRMLSSCIVTHAGMKAFERFCNWFMTNNPPEPLNTTLTKVFTTKGKMKKVNSSVRAIQQRQQLGGNKIAAENTNNVMNTALGGVDVADGTVKVRRRRHVVEGRPLYGVIGFLEWILLAAAILAWYWMQFIDGAWLRPAARHWWPVFAFSYIGIHVIHFVLTLRDGYMISLTHSLALPRLFTASTSRPAATCWMSSPMHMKWKLLATNALFWVVVFAMKLPFDYFVICKPVVEPLTVVTQRNWLACKDKYYIYPIPCIGGDWLLLAGRVCPFLVIIFMDTSLFYQITITIFGIVRGLFKLDLGVLTSWDEVVKEFYKAPARWWHKCMSELGNDNQLAQLKQTMYLEEGSSGQVSDGMMFKKTVLTPEEILGRKVHFNGRRGADALSETGQSRTQSAAGSVAQSDRSTTMMTVPQTNSGALLPSSTNRSAMSKADDKDVKEKKRKEQEKRAEAEGRVAAKKAALAAGTGTPMRAKSMTGSPNNRLPPLAQRPSQDSPGGKSKPGAARSLFGKLESITNDGDDTSAARAGSARPTSGGGAFGGQRPPSAKPQEEEKAKGIKGLFNKLLGGDDKSENLDPVAKMTADVQRHARARPKTGRPPGLGNPALHGSSGRLGGGGSVTGKPGESSALPKMMSRQPPSVTGASEWPGKQGPGVLKKLTNMFHMSDKEDEGDDVDKMTRAVKQAALARKDGGGGGAARPRTGKPRAMPASRGAPSASGPAHASAQPRQPGSGSASPATSSSQQPEAVEKAAAPVAGVISDEDDDEYTPIPMEAFVEPSTRNESSAVPLRTRLSNAPVTVGGSDTANSVGGGSDASGTSHAGGQPIAESTEPGIRSTPNLLYSDDDQDVDDDSRSQSVHYGDEGHDVDHPLRRESDGWDGESDLIGSVTEALPMHSQPPHEHHISIPAVWPSEHITSGRAANNSHNPSSSSASTAFRQDSQQQRTSAASSSSFSRQRLSVASFSGIRSVRDLGPTALWWALSQAPPPAVHEDGTIHFADNSAFESTQYRSHGPGPVAEGLMLESSQQNQSRGNTSITVSQEGQGRHSLFAHGRNRIQPGPISEGAEHDVTGAPTRRAAILPGSTGHDDDDAPQRPPPSDKPYEAELNEVFGRPIDSSMSDAASSNHPGLDSSDDDESYAMPANKSQKPVMATPEKKQMNAGMTPPSTGKKKTARFADLDSDDGRDDAVSGGGAAAPGASGGGGGAASGPRKKGRGQIATIQDFNVASELFAVVPNSLRGADLEDDEPLLGRFLSKFNLWKKDDSKSPMKSGKSGRFHGMAVVAHPGDQDGQYPQQGGSSATDVLIDDVHYQMMMWNAFANAWDEIVDDVRQSDLISDKEVGMLKFVRLDLGSRHYGLRSILLPTFFYAGQIRKVVDTGSVTTAQVMVLNELRVLCVWLGCQIGLLSGKHAHVITSAPFHASNINVKHALHRKKFFQAGVKLIDLLEDMCSRQEVPFDMRDFAEHLVTMLTSMEGECFAIRKAYELKRISDEELELSNIMLEVVQEMKREVSRDSDHLKVLFKNSLSTSATANWKELLRVVRVIRRMLTATVAEATPTGEESQRALGFFINSLSHPSLDRPISLDKMWAWTIMTPLYEEDVMYPLEGTSLAKELGLRKKKLTDLLTEGEDSISLMSYLKSTFPDEWNNFKERMKTLVPDVDVKELSEMDFAADAWLYDYRMELQLWASCRGQLLARTVTGMMRNEKALRVLAKLEHPKPPDMSELEYHQWMDNLVTSRFEMVITPQTYGKNKESKDVRLRWLAKSIDLLLQRYPKCLKAAFLEKADVDGAGIVEYSVCIKGRDPEDLNQLPHLEDQPVYELYRVRLPQNKYSARGVIIGEGKPENQNHAVIFAHGEGIQAIDMNQDGYLCEWLKFRNLLSELQPSGCGDFHLYGSDDNDFTILPTLTGSEVMSVIRYRMMQNVQTALVGFREYIFSEAAGALGRFAAATEYAFGTISQRTMTHPARVRLHYGHPDLFNKLYVMTRGGISKATRLLHLTEDVFCGCNHTLRGARIRYKEYISCGKGRDMGFDSINGFNFKIAGGGGEWAISRESFRMGTRLDFFRLMAFYHAAVGFYVNSWFTYLAVYLNVYALLLFAWAQATEIQADSVQRVYNVQQVLQLGTLALIPYAGQLMLENGLIKTVLTLFQQIATGSLLFYTFQQQTVAASFSTDMSYGSGKYVGTGRGFNIQSLEFVKIFTLYARSHLYMAFELLFALATLYIVRDCPSCNYGALTWSSWLLAVTLLFSPLWFNPFSFDMSKVGTNYLSWRRWMDGDVDPTTGSNWYTWNTLQLEKIRDDAGNNTDNWLNIVGVILATTPYLLMALGAASRLNICLDLPHQYVPLALCNGYLVFLMASAAVWFLVHVTIVLRHHWLDVANHKPWRIYTWLVSFAMIAFLIGFLVGVQRILRGRAVDVLFLVLYANFNLLIAFHKIITPWLSQNNTMRAFTDWFYYSIDTLIGYIMFILMGLLSFIGIVGVLQMKLLFNDSFSEQVKHAKIGRAMKEQKVGFDTTKGSQGGQQLPAAQRPGTGRSAVTTATGISMASLNQSEHRYM